MILIINFTEYPFAKFDKQLEVLRYNDEEYEKYFQGILFFFIILFISKDLKGNNINS